MSLAQLEGVAAWTRANGRRIAHRREGIGQRADAGGDGCRLVDVRGEFGLEARAVVGDERGEFPLGSQEIIASRATSE